MAAFKLGEVTGETKDEMVTTYAALILHDAEKEVTPENINTLVAASGNSVEPYWPTLFAKLLKTFEMKDLLLSGGGGGGGGGLFGYDDGGADY